MICCWSFESKYGKHCNTILRTQWSHKDGINNAQHWVSIPYSYSGEMIWNRLWHSVTSLRTMADMYTLQLPVTVLTKLHNEHASFTYCQLLVRCNVHLAPIFTIYTTHFPVHPPTDVHLTVYSLLTCMTSVICTYHYLLLTDLYISLNDLYISFYFIYWLVHLTVGWPQWFVHISIYCLLTCASHYWMTYVTCTYHFDHLRQ